MSNVNATTFTIVIVLFALVTIVGFAARAGAGPKTCST